ncbi:MAG: hypothetical protein KDA96_27525 [Planctomycetaceae bacterium]|nr:hypothetical protein [Planctomycetaceae bacterium]
MSIPAPARAAEDQETGTDWFEQQDTGFDDRAYSASPSLPPIAVGGKSARPAGTGGSLPSGSSGPKLRPGQTSNPKLNASSTCQGCGKTLDPGVRFCVSCGANNYDAYSEALAINHRLQGRFAFLRTMRFFNGFAYFSGVFRAFRFWG